MLEKILDKYYAKKLEMYLRNSLAEYYIDKKFVYTKHLLELYLKKTKWKDEHYVLVMAIPYGKCFEAYICGRDDLKKDLIGFIHGRLAVEK